MENGRWVKRQFAVVKKLKGEARYREALLLTSFIETVIKDAATPDGSTRKNFRDSLKALGLKIPNEKEDGASYKQDCQHREDCLIEINALRVQRNRLLHDIIREDLAQECIEDTVRKMAKNIKCVCMESGMIREYFRTEYGFDPADLI
jgi:hypothetical protein